MSETSSTMIGREVKLLGKHGFTYGLAGILSNIVSFLMVPLYTRFLSTTDYGIAELAGLAVEVISIVVGMGLADAVYRFYYDTNDPREQKCVISTALIGVSLMGICTVAVVSLFLKPLAALVLERSGQWRYLALALATLWFNQLGNVGYTYLRVRQQSARYLLLSVSRLLVTVLLNIYFIAILRIGVLGMFISNLVASLLFSMLIVPVVIRQSGLRFSFPMARQMLRYSLPVVPSNLCSLIVNASDRFFVKGYLSIADAGIYALGYKLGNVVFYLVRSPFMQIWSPRSFALYREGAPPEVFARIATYFNAVMVFVGLGVAVYVKDVIKLISAPPYWGAAQYAPAVTLCYIIYALDNLVAFGISAKKRTEYWTMVNLVASGVNIVGNFVLISRFGIWGAVWSTGISITVKVGLLYIVGRHFFSIPFEWPRMAVIMGVAAALYALSRQIVLPGLAAALLVDTVLIAAFLPAMWLLGLVRRDEKQQVARYAGRVWRSLRWVEAASK